MSQTTGRIYRIKLSESDANTGYWKYVPDATRWIQLAALDKNDEKFNWQINPVPGTPNLFTIRPADSLSIGFGSSGPNNTGVYWGYGFAQGKPGDTTQWQIVASSTGKYSKLKINNYKGGYVLDCRVQSTSQLCIHFYPDQDVPDAKNQRWSFQLVKF